jgi:hypothetical protein
MEQLGYLRIVPRKNPDGTDTANSYDFRPLIYAHVAVQRRVPTQCHKFGLDRNMMDIRAWDFRKTPFLSPLPAKEGTSLSSDSIPSLQEESPPPDDGSATLSPTGVKIDTNRNSFS